MPNDIETDNLDKAKFYKLPENKVYKLLKNEAKLLDTTRRWP